MSVTTDAARPWVQLYRDGQPADIAPEYPNLLQMFAAAVERAPDQVAIRYFDGAMTVAELDAASDALAAALHDLDFAPRREWRCPSGVRARHRGLAQAAPVPSVRLTPHAA